MAIVWECYYPRWRTKWPPTHANIIYLRSKWATITYEVSKLIVPKSRNRFLEVAIVWQRYNPRYRPIWRPKIKYEPRYTNFCVLAPY